MAKIKTAVFMDQTWNSKDEVFHFLAEQAVEKGFAKDAETVYLALAKREKEGTTGMMDGFAIPHGKSNTIIEPGILIVTLKNGVEWEAMDGKPTTFVLAMLIPEAEKGEGHLKILSQVARMLMKEKVKTELKQADTPQQIEAVLEEYIQ